MDTSKKDNTIEKLEKEFSAFQVEWKKFLANDLPHLTADVGSLEKNVATSIGHIAWLMDSQKATEKSIQVIDQNIQEILKRMK